MAKHTTYGHIYLLEDLQTEKILLTDALADSSLGVFILLGHSEKLEGVLETINVVNGILKSFPADKLGIKDIQSFWIKDLSLLEDESLKKLVNDLLAEENRAEGLDYKEEDFKKVAALSLVPGSNRLCAILYHDTISSIKVNSAGTKALLAALKAKRESPEA